MMSCVVMRHTWRMGCLPSNWAWFSFDIENQFRRWIFGVENTNKRGIDLGTKLLEVRHISRPTVFYFGFPNSILKLPVTNVNRNSRQQTAVLTKTKRGIHLETKLSSSWKLTTRQGRNCFYVRLPKVSFETVVLACVLPSRSVVRRFEAYVELSAQWWWVYKRVGARPDFASGYQDFSFHRTGLSHHQVCARLDESASSQSVSRPSWS